MRLTRRDNEPDYGFMEIPFPPKPGFLDGLPPDADGNMRTAHAWSRAQRWAEALSEIFGAPPEGALWGCEALERDFHLGEWPDGEDQCYAYVSIGVLIRHGDAQARAFADRVRAGAPKEWPARCSPTQN